MHPQKRALVRAITVKALASLSNTAVQYLSKVINGHLVPSLDKARILARCANELCVDLDLPAVFEITDFNINANPNLKDLCDDVEFVVHSVALASTHVLSAKQLLNRFNHDPELIELLMDLAEHGIDKVEHFAGCSIRLHLTEDYTDV